MKYAILPRMTFEKYVIFPIKYPKIWDMYKRSQECFWRVEEVSLAQDIKDWDRLTNDDRHFIKMVLGFFASSDGIVSENLALRFYGDTDIPEARAFYSFQLAIESIHGEMYSTMIDTLIKDKDEKDRLFRAVENYPCIEKKAKWAQQWITNSNSYAVRLVAFAVVEGIFFSSSFSAIYWIKKRGLMPGLTLSNDFISRDESLHTDHAILLYELQPDKMDEKSFHHLVNDAVEVELEFVEGALPVRLIGMNKDHMKQYVKFVADRLCVQLGYSKLYNSTNPFDWMLLQSTNCKKNFFERVVSDYGLAKKTDDSIFGQGEDIEF
jgi:ribonucleoside-diphosphate reductase subunit M2